MARKLPQIDPNLSFNVRDIAGLGKLVRNQRAVNSLRIDDAAALCGVSSDVLSRLENGKPITLDKLMAILDGMGMHMIVLPARHAVALAPALLQEITDSSGRPGMQSNPAKE
jgi:transcriptional regulator with XRE-family HTH domain